MTPRFDLACRRRALLIFAAALLLRIVYLIAVSRTACLAINLDPISDMEAFHRWGIALASGDWLDRANFHPFHPWQPAVAPEEQWRAWYGRAYHQEPFYPYVIALVYLAAPDAPASVLALQLLLGAVGCAATYLAARRLVEERAALASGVLAVLYGPYLYYESLLLRDSLLIPLQALLLWLLAEAASRHPQERALGWWGAAGLLGGAICLTKLTFLPALALWLAWTAFGALSRRGDPSTQAPAARPGARRLAGRLSALAPQGVFCLGIVAVAALPVARNLIVGAPALQLTTRGPIEFINGNSPWHPGTGWFDGDDHRVSRYAGEVLSRSGGRLLPAALDVLSGWRENLPGLARLQVRKLGYFFAPFEMPNNASYSYFRSRLPGLHLLLSFGLVSPLVAAGVAVSLRAPSRLALVYLLVAPSLVVTVAFYVIARFRAPLLPGMLILAGLGAVSLFDPARRRRWRLLVAPGLAAAAVVVLNVANSYPDRDLIRPQDYIVSIEALRSRGDLPGALREARDGEGLFPDVTLFHREAARLSQSLGLEQDALRAWKEALRRDPADAEARREVLRLERALAP